MAETFDEFVTRERARIHGERDKVFTQQAELQTQLDTLNRQLTAITAYEAAMSGKAPAAPRAAGGGRKGSKRDALLKAIQEAPGGVTRGDLLEKLGLKGNKSGEMSVSNTLTGLIKSKEIDRRDGKYVPVHA